MDVRVYILLASIFSYFADSMTFDQHRFVASFSATDKPISGFHSFDLGTGLVSNISLFHRWNSGSGTVSITSGGIGLNSLSIRYELLEGSELISELFVTSTQQEDYDGLHQMHKHEKSNNNNNDNVSNFSSQVIAGTEENWSVSNVSRTVISELVFGDVIIQCSGHSKWRNGSGYSFIYGGIGIKSFKVASLVPAEESGTSAFNCEFSTSTGKNQRRIQKQISESVDDEVKYSNQQIYGSIYENGYITWQFNQEIVGIRGGPVWKLGKGTFEVVDGGVGSKNLVFRASDIHNSFGYYEYIVSFLV